MVLGSCSWLGVRVSQRHLGAMQCPDPTQPLAVTLSNVPSAWCPLSKETSNKVRLNPSLHESAPWEHDLESLAGSQTSSVQSGVQCVLYSVCTRALNPQLLLSSLAANTTILALPREHRR